MALQNTKLTYLPLRSLSFDPQNPRLPVRYRHKSDEEVIEWMLQDASLMDLVISIGQNGYFPGEPMLCAPSEKEGIYVVIEGNRRLAACKILSQPTIATVKQNSIKEAIKDIEQDRVPLEIPVFIFEKREDIMDYLGYRHVTGVKSWGALAKARYLFDMYKNLPKQGENEKYRFLARKIGSKSDYVQRLLIGYQLYLILENEHYFDIKNLDEESIEFSNLVDASLRYTHLKQFLNIDTQQDNALENLNKRHFIELTRWLFEKNSENYTRVGESRNILLLNKVVGNERALKAFRNGATLNEAHNLTAATEELLQNSIKDSLRFLQKAHEYMPLVEDVDSSLVDDLRSISRYVKVLYEAIQAKETSKDVFL